MGALTDTKLSGLTGGLLHKWRERSSHQHRSGDILNAIEMVIDGTDGKIRLVRGYKNKLFDGVGSALEFVDELVHQIPAAIEISSRKFISDPYVNAFFTNIDELHTILGHSSEIRDFIEEYGAHGQLQCCCLLCMQKTERSVFGMELSGDILKKEVRQTSVCFSDHRIYSPATTEAATRRGLRECLFGGLVTNALERIMQSRVENNRLQCDRRMLNARLRHLEYKRINAQGAPQIDTKLTKEIEEIKVKIRANEDRLMATRMLTPRESLDIVRKLLKQPDNYIQLNRSTIRLDKMGIRIADGSEQPCNKIDLTEVAIGGEPPRVVTLAQFPVGELFPQTNSRTRRMFS